MYHTNFFVTFITILWSGVAGAQITVDFTHGDTTGCGSLQASFCAEASSTAGPIVSYKWNLGGVSSTQECPGRIFGNPGQYTICLTATDSKGNSDSRCKEGLIKVFALPQPDFEVSDTVGCSPLKVVFTDRTVADQSKITRWIWGLGGANSVVDDDGSLEEISTTYTLADLYGISLSVRDEHGCFNTIKKESLIEVFASPQVEVSTADTFSCAVPYEVEFFNDSPQEGATFSWDFGNGNGYSGFQPPPVNYLQSGQYTVEVSAQFPQTGCTTILELEDVVSITHPVEFSASSRKPCLNAEISFFDDSPTPADSIIWDFGDGTQSTLSNPQHTYTTSDRFAVTLTRYLDGCESKATLRDFIEVLPLPTITYSVRNEVGCALPHTVHFEASSPDGQSWFWDFGDGKTSTEQNPSHVYTDFGDYEVKITTTNGNGCRQTISTELIKVNKLQAAISQEGTSGCIPLSVGLQDASITVAPITNWEWTFQGRTFNEASPQIIIADTGKFDVKLVVENSLGCVDSVLATDVIRAGAAIPVEFGAIPQFSCLEQSVQFEDLSSHFADDWMWTIGDTVVNEQHPLFLFPQPGIYTVTLLASQNGCGSEITKKDFIEIAAPKASFTLEQNCENPLLVSFVQTAVGADRLHWDFGVQDSESDTSSQENPVFEFPSTGEYAVSLTAYNFSTGCTHVATTIVKVTNPVAAFNLNTTQGCVPLTVQLTDASAFANKWSWSAPQGSISDPGNSSPSLKFNRAGKFSDIQLTITDINGCSDTFTYSDTIFVNDVTANFNLSSDKGCAPLNVNLLDRSASRFAQLTEWSWEVGNATASGRQTQILLDKKGLYPVKLQVTDSWGCIASRTIPEGIFVTDPVAAFSSDTLSCTPTAVQFRNSSQGTELQYFWEFGDGESALIRNPSHRYVNEGVYSVCLTVTDVNGCSDTFCRPNYIKIADPIADFEVENNTSSCPPLIVQFSNNSVFATSYSWDFGDNTGRGDLKNPAHVYTVPGFYDVTLVAKLTEVCTDTLVKPDLIGLGGPKGTISVDVDTSCVPVKVTLTGASNDSYQYTWDMGNGDIITRAGTIDRDTVVYYYREPGIFTPLLLLNDVITDCEVILTPQNSVFVGTLEVDFAALDTTLCGAETEAHFVNLTKSNAPITFLEWSFEGGSPRNSNKFEPKVSFVPGNSYDVQLVAGNGFCVDTLFRSDYLRVGAIPEAQISMTPDKGCAPLVVEFEDASSVATGSIVERLWDFGDEGTSDRLNPTHLFQHDANYQVRLSVTSDFGCSDTVTTTVEVRKPLEVKIAPLQPLCIGDKVPLEVSINDTTNVIVSWNNDGTLSCTDCVSPLASPEDTVTYTVFVQNDIGCIASADISVDVRPFRVPEVKLTEDTTLCPDQIMNLYVSGGEDVFSYKWDRSRPGLSCYTNCANPIAAPQSTTTYLVTVTNRHNCSAKDSVTINVRDVYRDFAGEDQTICINDSVQLAIERGIDPRWLNPTGLNCTYCPSPIASPRKTTLYRIAVTDESGCESTDSVKVTVIQQDAVNAGENRRLCLGDELVLSGVGEGTVRWSPDLALSNPAVLNPSASPMQTTTYVLSVDNGYCILLDSVTIEVLEKAEIDLEDATICEGEDVQLLVLGEADHYQWFPDDFGNIPNPLVAPLQTTEYAVVAEWSTCLPDTARAIVEVIPRPKFNLPPERFVFQDRPIKIGVDVDQNGHLSYQWWPTQGLSCGDCPNPEFAADSARTYTIMITDSANGCLFDDQTAIRLFTDCGPDILQLPNAFSPNEDGKNDRFIIQSGLITNIDRFQIYDRWGALLFESSDINEGWDGTYRGKLLPAGVYIYLVQATCEVNGKNFHISGDVSLLR